MARPRKIQDRRASKGFPNPIDVWVGSRIRQARTILGMSQEVLAQHMGLTFQQIQKYEKGANRISGSRLYDAANVLEVDIPYFFAGMPNDIAEMTPSNLNGASPAKLRESTEVVDGAMADPLFKRLTIEFVRAYDSIPDETVRDSIRKLVRSLSDDEGSRRGRRPNPVEEVPVPKARGKAAVEAPRRKRRAAE